MLPVILIHYHEIALKGKNRPFFENILINNLKQATGKENISKDFGRIVIRLEKQEEFNQSKTKITDIFGIADFSLAFEEKKDYQQIKNSLLNLIKDKIFKTFAIDARRSDKNFPLSSPEINKNLGQLVSSKTKAKVDLENPNLKIFLEIGQKNAYLYFEKIAGPGGLPVSSAGQLLCLISGGIDSPVAAHQMIKRGARVDFIHFHSYPQTNQASIEKVKEIITYLNRFQFEAKLYLVPILDLQKEFFKLSNHRFLIILYRRAMFKIAQTIALKNGYAGLISGESLGQVASQTLANLTVISQRVKIPIYRPLIGNDKQEIINLARKIGTYDLSIKPQMDCCSLFAPKHPSTQAKLEIIIKEESKVDLPQIIRKIYQQLEIIKINHRELSSIA